MLSLFRTTDIVLAACLKLEGFQLERIECRGKQGTFVFADVDPKVIDAFNCGRMVVEPTQFHGMVRQLSASVVRQITATK
jgi:hypothetical protein